MVRDPKTSKYRRTRQFVLTLGYSRKSVRLLSWRSSARIWAELHEQSFRRLGCSPRVVVLDNLREGVAVPDIYDPTVNPLFRDVLAHYGVVTPRTQKITWLIATRRNGLGCWRSTRNKTLFYVRNRVEWRMVML
jgi:transposase